MATMEELQQEAAAGSIVELFELDARSIDGVSIFRFTPGTNNAGAAVSFGGQTYTPAPVIAQGFDQTSRGQFPQPTIEINNVFATHTGVLRTYDDLIGATLVRKMTFERYLDTGAEPDSTKYRRGFTFVVARKIRHNRISVKFQLASAMDQQGMQLPNRIMMRRSCPHVYRRYDSAIQDYVYDDATCPYAGDTAYDAEGNVTSKANDVCSKRLEDGCLVRFGERGLLPFQGFPGMLNV